MNAEDIIHRLLDTYPKEKGWEPFRELSSRAGFDSRRIDLYLMNTCPSTTRTLAVEVKVSRSDFARELEDPTKRKPWESLAGECWFACPSGIIRRTEVPEGWGLMIVGEKVRRVHRAPQRQIDSWPASFVMSLARRCSDPPPAWPPGAWHLSTGSKVCASDLRRLSERLAGKDKLVQRRIRDKERERRRDAAERMRLLGGIKRELERHFRRRFTAPHQVWEALQQTAQTPPSNKLRAVASQLRQIADHLER